MVRPSSAGVGLSSRVAPARHLTPLIVVLAAIAGWGGAFESIDRVFVNVLAIGLALSLVMYGLAAIVERLPQPAVVDRDNDTE